MTSQNNPHIDPEILAALSGYVDDDKAIAVAVSGGGDSMALLLGLHHYIKTLTVKPKLIALTVDHKLRPDSANEAVQVGKWCKNLSIEHHILAWQFEQMPTSGIQQKAREARYQLMTEFCAQNQISKLFVAHNLEDNAETFFMRLKRGAGLKGLSAIANRAERLTPNGKIIEILRPFLNLKRATLRAFLTQRQQAWLEDVSNQNEKFERVQVRNFLAQTDDFNQDQIAKSAQALARANAALEHYTEVFWQHDIAHLSSGIGKLDLEKFNNLPSEIQLRILARLVWTLGGQDQPPRWQKIEALLAQIQTQGRQFCLGNCLIVKKHNDLWFGYENRLDEGKKLSLEPQQAILWQGRFYVKNHGQNVIHLSGLGDFPQVAKYWLKTHSEFKNCPKILLNNMPIIISEDEQSAGGFADQLENVEIHLKICR